jgi:ribonucleotide monophosphatase NagD (HAD superfamily)
VFLSNTQTRRAKLTADKLQALADHGLDWATVYRSGHARRFALPERPAVVQQALPAG